MLEQISSTLVEIKNALLNNANIRKLVFNDSNNALNESAPLVDSVDKYITLHPIYEFENKNNFSQNTMINIFLSDAENNEKVSINGIININVVVNLDKWTLLNNKIRPLELSDEIIKTLDNKKFSVSNPILFGSLNNLILSKKLVGYALLFSVLDGNSNLDKY